MWQYVVQQIEEKEKVARLAQRLVGLGRDHEQMKLQLIEANTSKLTLEQLLSQSTTDLSTQKETSTTAMNLLSLYQNKINHLADIYEISQKNELKANMKISRLEEDMIRLEALVTSQRLSIDSTKTQANLEIACINDQMKRLQNEIKIYMNQLVDKNACIENLKYSVENQNQQVIQLQSELQCVMNEKMELFSQLSNSKIQLEKVIHTTLVEMDAMKNTCKCRHKSKQMVSNTSSVASTYNSNQSENILRNSMNSEVPWSEESDTNLTNAVTAVSTTIQASPRHHTSPRKAYLLKKPTIFESKRKPSTGRIPSRKVTFEGNDSNASILGGINAASNKVSVVIDSGKNNNRSMVSSKRSVNGSSSAWNASIRKEPSIRKESSMGYDAGLLYLVQEIDGGRI